jgi:HEAT repeat protein
VAAAAGIGGVGLYRIWQEKRDIAALNDADSRLEAMEALRQHRSRRAVPHLVALLDDEDQDFRRKVLEALQDPPP